jgi:hypothetical protein
VLQPGGVAVIRESGRDWSIEAVTQVD